MSKPKSFRKECLKEKFKRSCHLQQCLNFLRRGYMKLRINDVWHRVTRHTSQNLRSSARARPTRRCFSSLSPMFRQFLRSSFRDIQRKTRISSTALTAVGVSGSLLYLTAGRNSPTKVIRCDSGSNLDDDELGLESGSVTGFKRPRWKEEDYLSADRILSSGPTWFPSPKSGVVRCDALIINACVQVGSDLFFFSN